MDSTSKALRLFDRVDQREYRFCRAINQHTRRPLLRGYFRLISRLGDGWFWYALILALPALTPSNGLDHALAMTATGLCCTLAYKALKHRLVRERPFISFPAIECGTPPLDRYSFPSGHTLHAACFQTMLCLTFPGLALWVLPFTLSVAASRVVLGLHYPSDVIAGAVIGAVMGALSVAWFPAVIAG
ncbi:phosphatase PAP2 family protein [Marinobacter sp. C2H3]|uniref:phosphatase PAP2 family protein n=1 Tax=Marinobacter sp. C2H3 TaxID=3119003 RepID=UPI00300ED303